MTKRFVDFDAAFNEADSEPITIHLFDEDWDLPAEMPAAFPLAIQRFIADGRDPNKDLTNGELLGLVRLMVPTDTLDAWLAQGLSMARLLEVLTWLMGEYGFVARDVTGEQVGPTGPETTSWSASSNGGDSSKPTSNGSTASTSRPLFERSAGDVS